MTSQAPAAGTLETLHPSYFALVMATGIVSLAAFLMDFIWLARGMFALNIVGYLVLWALYATRALLYPRAMLMDLADHVRGVGFFTVTAGTCVLGSQFVIIGDQPRIGCVLWVLGIVLWAVLTYGVLTLLTVRMEKPTLVRGLNGGWLVAVVAAQSVSVLGSQLADSFDSTRQPVLFFCLVMWLGGGMLYIWMISLIFYRYTFFTISPSDLAPPYWINMGAVAISTLAGTFLISNRHASPLLNDLLPFIQGMTLLFWATATWWIPMLVILGFWRHVVCRFPLRYDPHYWGAVFPLGMYTVCTHRLADTVEISFLHAVPPYFFFVALAAWTLTAIGLINSLRRRPRRT